MAGALNDPYLVLFVLFCTAAITIGAIVTPLRRVLNHLDRRAEICPSAAGALKAAGAGMMLVRAARPSTVHPDL
jgi:hypothetical protein